MKKIIPVIVLLMIGISCFSQPQVLASVDTDNLKASPAVVNSNKLGAGEVVPAPATTLRDYEQHAEHWQNDQLLAIALGYVNETNFTQAISSYKRFLVVQPNNVEAIRGLGNCYWLAHDKEAALVQFKRGYALRDDLSLLTLARTYCFLERYQDIKPLIKDLLKMRNRSTDTDVKLEITNILIAYSLKATPSDGKKLFLRTLEGLSDDFILESEDTARFAVLGLHTFGDQARANELYEKVERRKDAELYFYAGLRKDNAADHTGAIANYTKAIELFPESAGLYYNRAWAESKLGKYEMAVIDYTKTIELTPKSWAAYVNRGNAKFDLGDIAGAVKDYTKATELNPNDFLTYQHLGRIYSDLFQWRPALEAFRRALQLDPTLDYSHLSVWLIQTRLGDREKATKELTVYLQFCLNDRTNNWSVKIGQFLTESLTKEELLRVGEDDATMKNARLCQACYYIGMKYLLAGNENTAAEYFRRSLDTKAKDSAEYYSAAAELHALRR
jgi:tetratricopeptide (TPR) repeat protein